MFEDVIEMAEKGRRRIVVMAFGRAKQNGRSHGCDRAFSISEQDALSAIGPLAAAIEISRPYQQFQVLGIGGLDEEEP
ncbi:hypothetical protein [Tunturiibacter gelidoferens]|uniref:Uncharacterized protein n=1 Tax=Tunturiibacter gelidiferens TaxID=3069689 RepID=A0A9X0U4K3_9BACT|nr:hypothetical protein [Edaphobacter lichenicola]MBB5327952.1 hypothetical protein [Edaphobacter lichenicola]